jgi:hypothetical protein
MEYYGRFVNIVKENGNIRIVLNNNGVRIRKEVDEIRERLGSIPCLRVLLDDHLKRQWTEILPEEIGALTAGTILSDEATRDAAGKLLAVERVYWHQAYQVEDPIEAIAGDGCEFQGFD